MCFSYVSVKLHSVYTLACREMSDCTKEVLPKFSVFDLPIDLRSDPSVSKVVQQFGFVVH